MIGYPEMQGLSTSYSRVPGSVLFGVLNKCRRYCSAHKCEAGVDAAVRPEAIVAALRSALRLQQDNSVTSLGQETIYPGAAVCNGNTLALLQDPATLVACAAPRLVNA